MAAGKRSAKRVDSVHVQVSGRSDNAGRGQRDDAAGVAARAAGKSRGHAEDPDNAAFVWRRTADPGEPAGAGGAARLAGRAAVYLSRRAGAGESQDAPEAGLSLLDDLGRDREDSGNEVSR